MYPVSINHREKVSLLSTQLHMSLSVCLCMHHRSHLCVHRGENSLSWLWQWVYDFFLFPVTEGKGKYFSVVEKKKSKKRKNHHKCVIMWCRKAGLWRRMWHLTLLIVIQPLHWHASICACVCAHSLWHYEIALYVRVPHICFPLSASYTTHACRIHI